MLLSIVLLVAVLSESAVLATIVTFAVMTIGLIVAQRALLERLMTSEESRAVVRWIYYLLPKVWDLGNLSRKFALGGPMTADWMPVWSSALFGVVVLGTGLYAFSKRNY